MLKWQAEKKDQKQDIQAGENKKKKNQVPTLGKQFQLGQEMKGCAPRTHDSMQNYFE